LREKTVQTTLGFLNNFSGSGTAATSSGYGFFVATGLLVDDEEVRGVLVPLTSLLGARITTEESPGE
jgi:hypothetical protein